MLNKFLIPAALVATVVIAGIFAFIPVEKASTVHGTLATATSLTNANTNTNKSATGADKFLFFEKNYTIFDSDSVSGKTIVRLDSGTTNGIIVIGATANAQTDPTAASIECGATTGEDGTIIAGNATSGSATSIVNGTFSITSGTDILFGPDGASTTIGGVCTLFIQFDVTDG